jgi:hypothetical protein
MRTIYTVKIIILILILFHFEIKFTKGQSPPPCMTSNISTGNGNCLPTGFPVDYGADFCSFIDNDFRSDCPNCSTDLYGDFSPCYLKGVNSTEVTGVNFTYVLIFDDEFTGNAIDLSKWFTANNVPAFHLNGTIDYDNGTNFQFDNPGLEELDKYSSSPTIYNHRRQPKTNF